MTEFTGGRRAWLRLMHTGWQGKLPKKLVQWYCIQCRNVKLRLIGFGLAGVGMDRLAPLAAELEALVQLPLPFGLSPTVVLETAILLDPPGPATADDPTGQEMERPLMKASELRCSYKTKAEFSNQKEALQCHITAESQRTQKRVRHCFMFVTGGPV